MRGRIDFNVVNHTSFPSIIVLTAINEFIRMWTADIYLFDRGPSPSERVNGSVACRPPPRPLQGGYSNGPDLNATFTFVCPRSPRLGLGRVVAPYLRTPS